MNEKQFEQFYVEWYSRMVSFAKHYVLYTDIAENIVQDVFLDFFRKKNLYVQPINNVAFLLTCVKNRCLDYLRRQVSEQKVYSNIKKEKEIILKLNYEALDELDTSNLPDEDLKLKKMLNETIESLPEKCRKIFILNKIEHVKQKDIAKRLGISINTVESQMSIAYKKLKQKLKPKVNY